MRNETFRISLDVSDKLTREEVADSLRALLQRGCDPYDDAYTFPYGAGDVDLLSIGAERPTVADMDFAELELRVIAHASDRSSGEALIEKSRDRERCRKRFEDRVAYGGTLVDNITQARSTTVSAAIWQAEENERRAEAERLEDMDKTRRESHDYDVRRVRHLKSGIHGYMRNKNDPWGGVEVQHDTCPVHKDKAPEGCELGPCLTLGWTITVEEDYELVDPENRLRAMDSILARGGDR